MDIAHLASFYEVVLRGSFSAAADTLGVSKGMLSRHVSALESALNAQLLQRTTRHLSLTEAGKTLYQQAGEIFALARQAELDIQVDPAVFLCQDCGEKTVFDRFGPDFVCGGCGSENVRLLSGKAFKIISVAIV